MSAISRNSVSLIHQLSEAASPHVGGGRNRRDYAHSFTLGVSGTAVVLRILRQHMDAEEQ